MTVSLSRLPRRHFACIYADPAWSFRTYTGEGTPHRTAEDHYAVMGLDAMTALPVGELAADDCALAMWVIGSHLEQAFPLARSWGFQFKTDLFTWVKVGRRDPDVRPISLGYWTRKQTETCLLFTRGKPKRLDAGVRQLIESGDNVIFAPKREHSRKPDEAYARLERLVAGPRLELFARTRRSGWDSWGNETDKFVASQNGFSKYAHEFADLIGNAEVEEDIIG